MNIAFYITGFIVLLLIIRYPYIGVALILALSAAQGVIGDRFDQSELYFFAVGIATMLSLLLNLISKIDKPQIQFSSSSILILIFALFLILSNKNAALNSADRNWFLTYSQLFVLVFLIENTITDRKWLENVMMFFSVITVFYFVNIVTVLLESDKQGFIEGANLYSRAFVIAALFSYYLLKRFTKYRMYFVILILIQCAGVFLSQSRTGIILLFVSLIFILFKDYKLSFKSLFVICLGGSFLYFLVPHNITDSIVIDFYGNEDISRSDKIDYSSIDSNIRFVLWGIGYDLWIKTNIFLGIGIGQFKELVVNYFPGLEVGIGLHNTYLSILFETGVFGFLIFMGFILKSLRIYIKSAAREEEIGIAMIWLMAYITILIGGITKHDHYDKFLFAFVGISHFFTMARAKLQWVR